MRRHPIIFATVLALLVLGVVSGIWYYQAHPQISVGGTAGTIDPKLSTLSGNKSGSKTTSSLVANFSGKVQKNDSFRQDLGQNLIFELAPGNGGWTVSVFNSQYPDHDYSAFNLPLRWSNIRAVNNDYGAKAADQVAIRHDFNFVLDESEYQKGWDALQVLMWPYNYTEAQTSEARTTFDNLKTARAKFSIGESTVTTPDDNKLGEITDMSFQVEITYPSRVPRAEANSEEAQVRALVTRFENAVRDEDVPTLLSLFTPATSTEDLRAYQFIKNYQGRPFFGRNSYRVISWQISQRTYPDNAELISKEGGHWLVNVDEDRQNWVNSEKGYASGASTAYLAFEIVKSGDRWMIDKYYYLPGSPRTDAIGKFEGLLRGNFEGF